MSTIVELERKFRVKKDFNIFDLDIVKSIAIEQHYLLTDISNIEISAKSISITAADGRFLAIREREGNKFFVSFGESMYALSNCAITHKFYKEMYDFISHVSKIHPEQYNKILADVRIRSKGKAYLLTLKSTGDEARNEFEDEITHGLFEGLVKLSDGVILKTRYVTRTQEEIDIYDTNTPLSGLITMEREFTDYEMYNAYVTPNYVLNEVTTEADMKNKSLALYGVPVRYQVT